jgi:hypothetical protein
MTPSFQKFILAALVLLAAVSSFGQVYSQGIYAGGVTYYPSRWTVGSPPFRFGLEEYSYSTDGAGYIIMISPGRATQPGDIFHWRTRILLGPVSFPVPLRQGAVAIIGGSVVLLFGVFVATFKLRSCKLRRDEIRVS